MKNILFLLSVFVPLSAMLGSCDRSDTDLAYPAKMPLVVEGWIEDEGLPVVIITRAANLSTTDGPIDNLVQRWCKVTVSDGTSSETLPMRINTNYLPSVVYSANRLRGKVGHTYTLTIETDMDTVTAVTTIPPIARLDSLRTGRVEGSDSLFQIRAYGRVDASKCQYYKIFTQVYRQESHYYSSFLGTFTADEYDAVKGWNVARGIHDTFDGHFSPYFHRGDTVNVKLCTMDSVAYDFWQSYEATVSLGGNMFFTSTDGCVSNIQGGLGYWAGYGTSMARIVIPKE